MKKLLIVDDEDAMRGLYRRRLASAYEVFETGDPEQALALALQHKPDAILLDLKMPKFNGFELCQNFRMLSYTASLPIFVLTGQSGDYRKECERIKANGYFEKPIDFNQLKQTLAAVLNTTSPKQREIPALRMRVALKLQGTDAVGEQFTEMAETESVSSDGFLCESGRNIAEGSVLDVFLAGRTERYAGRARVVEHFSAGLQRQRYRFGFDGGITNWILQKSESSPEPVV